MLIWLVAILILGFEPPCLSPDFVMSRLCFRRWVDMIMSDHWHVSNSTLTVFSAGFLLLICSRSPFSYITLRTLWTTASQPLSSTTIYNSILFFSIDMHQFSRKAHLSHCTPHGCFFVCLLHPVCDLGKNWSPSNCINYIQYIINQLEGNEFV